MSSGKKVRLKRKAIADREWLEYLVNRPWLQRWTNSHLGYNLKSKRINLTLAERIRFKYWLYWKYGPECAYCHRFYDWRYALTLDHIQPVSRGGALRDICNMVLACLECNRSKGDSWDTFNI